MKLNNKGYMLVEIIVASVLAIGIAYYLLNLTYKFKNTYEDVQQSYYYMKDKIVVTKSIMSDLDGVVVSNVTTDNKSYVEFIISNNSERRRLEVRKIDGKDVIQYGKYESGGYVVGDSSYYEKEFESTLMVGTLDVISDDGLRIEIPLESIYDDYNYSIKIFANM